MTSQHNTGNLYLLEVDKLGFVGIQEEALAVVANRIPADIGLCVLKLLLHILYDALTVQAEESSAHQLRMDRVGANNLATDPDQCPNAQSGQLPDPEKFNGQINFTVKMHKLWMHMRLCGYQSDAYRQCE